MKKRLIKMVTGILIISSLVSGCGSTKSDSGMSLNPKAKNASDYKDSPAFDEAYVEEFAEEELLDMTDAAITMDFAGYDEINEDSKESDTEYYDETEKSSEENGADLLYEDKLVYESNLSIETLDFDKTYSELIALIEKNGGRIESESYDAHYGSYTNFDRNRDGYHTTKQDYIVIRIPSSNYNAFISADTSLGNVVGKTQTLTNISQNYYSTKTKIELLEGQLEYYKYQLALIEEKLMSCEDYEYVISQMVELEDRIIYVQDQINQYSNNIKTMDMQVSYSTIYLELIEVKEYTEVTNVTEEKEETFVDRLLDNLKGSGLGFLRFLEGLLTILIYVVPYLLVIGIVAFVIVKIAASSVNSKSKKNVMNSNNSNDKNVSSKEIVNADSLNEDNSDKNILDK